MAGDGVGVLWKAGDPREVASQLLLYKKDLELVAAAATAAGGGDASDKNGEFNGGEDH